MPMYMVVTFYTRDILGNYARLAIVDGYAQLRVVTKALLALYPSNLFILYAQGPRKVKDGSAMAQRLHREVSK